MKARLYTMLVSNRRGGLRPAFRPASYLNGAMTFATTAFHSVGTSASR